MQTRRATAPIPPHLVERFYQVAWDIAFFGQYVERVAVDDVFASVDSWDVNENDGVVDEPPKLLMSGRVHMARRHALCCLWMTACALRFSELRRLKVTDVSRSGYSAFVTRSKGGLSGQIELSKRLIALTFDWRGRRTVELNSEWLIPTRTGQQLSINAFNRDACGMMRSIFGIPLTSHCFRDTACQMAIVQSADVRVVQRLMGHRSASTTEHYLRKQEAKAFQLALPFQEAG